MKIVIITEGSNEIGFGHITRCMSLYQAFREKELSVQFVVNGDSTIEPFLGNTEYNVFNWLYDSYKLFKSLNDSDIVIIDSYLADEEFYKMISKSVVLAVYIDDNKRINYPKGIVINGSILAGKLNYPPKKEVEYLLDSQYIPLRREFWNVPEKGINTSVQSIMVTFGGDDLRNLTPNILKILIDKYTYINKKVVIGRGFKKISEIEDLKDNKTELIYYPDAKGMLKVMLESDIAISAGGQTLYELARVGLPTIAIGVAYNQTHNVKNWQKVGFTEFAGFWNDEKLYDSVAEKLELFKDKEIRLKKCRKGRKAVNGKGAIKIVEYCLNKYYAKKISLRHLESRDIHNIYELSNEDKVRQNSFNSEKIKFEDHEKWFKNKMEDHDNVFLVTEIGNDFAGQIRFDFDDNEAIISISINKKYREFGLGKHILKKSIEYLNSNVPQIKMIRAYIKENNKRSIRLFENMNFKHIKTIYIKNQRSLEYIYKIRD